MNIADLCVNTLFADVGDSFSFFIIVTPRYFIFQQSAQRKNDYSAQYMSVYADVEGKLRLKHYPFNLRSYAIIHQTHTHTNIFLNAI